MDNISINSEEDVRKILTVANAFNASDVLINSGRPILIRRYNKLYALTLKNLKDVELNMFLTIINGNEALSSIKKGKGLNFAYNCSAFQDRNSKSGKGYITTQNDESWLHVNAVEKEKIIFRCNVSACNDRTGNSSFQIVQRIIPSDPPTYDQIGLTEEFVLKAIPRLGITYVVGETGHGKSTTLASMVRYVYEEDTHIQGNIITLEEPIEFRYDGIKSKHSIIVQSQIPEHFMTFGLAVREAMRRKPALLLVAELRDQESFSAAIELSKTGHPVMSTIHSNDVANVLPRIMDLVPPDQQHRKLTETISTAHAFIAQRLVETPEGKLIGVREHLFFSKSIRNDLLDLAIQAGGYGLVIQYIRKMMNDNPQGTENSSPNFENQAKDLLNKGLISKKGFDALIA
ncbi:ATPase, T2SS/T4P/T4SS family [Acinetobacter pittii]|uniref:ATPase, T2SS/T4P/T4SS family n=1 Tax=Acinetobacter pittii TaxID=48296 RepID=UPI00208F260C|nr:MULTISPECIES: ATPase, T2SS/T4P/T4SS family [Acinetobacter calcoaceticus/baumannii complex]